MKVRFNKAPSEANEVNGLKINYAPTTRPFSAWRFKIVLVLFLSPFAIYALYLVNSFFLITQPGFIRLEEFQVKTSVEARVVSVVNSERRVKKGDVLAVLENKLLKTKYQNYLNRTRSGYDDNTELKNRQRELLQLSKSLYDYYKNQYKKILVLKKEGAVREYEVTASYKDLVQAKTVYLKEKKQLALKDTSEQVDFLNDMKMKELAKQISSLVVKSPYDAMVISADVKEYDDVLEHQTLMTLEIQKKPRIEVYLESSNAKYAVLGQSVKVIFPGNIILEGKVSNIQMKAVRTPNGLSSGFSKNNFAIVLEIKLEEDIADKFVINYLPIKIRFDFFENLFREK